MKVSVKVKPNAREARVEKIGVDNFLVWVKEKPQDDKANKAVVKILAEYLDVAKSNIALIKGKTSREKIFEVYGGGDKNG
jgi:uncharacterized protein YggU (UPF0235/DUF167 family)